MIFTIWFIRADNTETMTLIGCVDVDETENRDVVTALLVHQPEKDNDSGGSCCLSVTGSDIHNDPMRTHKIVVKGGNLMQHGMPSTKLRSSVDIVMDTTHLPLIRDNRKPLMFKKLPVSPFSFFVSNKLKEDFYL